MKVSELKPGRHYTIQGSPFEHMNGRAVEFIELVPMLLRGRPIRVPLVVDVGDADYVSYYIEPQFLVDENEGE